MKTENAPSMGLRSRIDPRHQLLDEPVPLPTEICGLSTHQVLKVVRNLDKVASDAGLFKPYSYEEKVKAGMIVTPLLKRVAAGDVITPNDVRPYRHAIRQFSYAAKWGDTMLGCLSLFPPVWMLTVPLRVVLNKKIEHEFIHAASEIKKQIQLYFAKAMPVVDVLARFDNPQAQFIQEVSGFLNYMVQPLGIESAESVEENLSLRAGTNIVLWLKNIKSDQSLQQMFPLLSGTLTALLPMDFSLPQADRLAIVAPEIAFALEKVLPQDKQAGVSDKLWNSRHPMRRQPTELLDIMGGVSIQDLPIDLSNFLIALRDVFPTNGRKFRDDVIRFGKSFEMEDTTEVDSSA